MTVVGHYTLLDFKRSLSRKLKCVRSGYLCGYPGKIMNTFEVVDWGKLCSMDSLPKTELEEQSVSRMMLSDNYIICKVITKKELL